MIEQVLRVQQIEPDQLHDLRRRVLRGGDPESLVSDPRDDEPTTLHLAGMLDERVVVSATFYSSPALFDETLVAYQLRYMATDFDVQGRGYGATVLEYAEMRLRASGAEQLWANGRDSALDFYRATGWLVVEGSAHLSAETGLAHHVIYRLLTNGSS